MRTTIQTMRIRFQSTHPHGVRLNPDQQHRNTRICFNPRTHTGCDTQGCTNAMPPFLFQSTHPHGVRRPKTWSIITYNSFNPRTHTGCDHGAELPSPAYEVSIHAPTRGATLPNDVMLEFSKFQSTHPHGVRLISLSDVVRPLVFQSTHPHGVRLLRMEVSVCSPMFQSTHPHGVRRRSLYFVCVQLVFQSTHPHGVRHKHCYKY